MHNFTRKCAKEPDAVRIAMVRGHNIVPAYGRRVTDVLRGMLRPALIPAKGKHLVVADWSAIEGRVNPWLAASDQGEAKLDVFRKRLDPYIVNAASAFGVPYETILDGYTNNDAAMTDFRQRGKVMELALGFAGGAGAFAAMGRNYGVYLPESDVRRMVDAWRRANPWSVRFWQQLEEAYTRAMRNVGHEFYAGRVAYMFDGQHLWYALPSRRVLCYPYARLESDGVTYAKASWKPAADATEWPRARLWKGLACIAKGTPVLTQRGWVEIETVHLNDLIWDGIEWVNHQGLAHQGIGKVNYAFGVAMTADHLVLTNAGWKRADQTKGHHRASCRLPDGYEVVGDGRASSNLADNVRLRADAGYEAGRLSQVGSRGEAHIVRMPQERVAASSAKNAWYESASGFRRVAVYAGSLPLAYASSMGKLWRAWHSRMQSVARIVREFLGRHGANVSGWAMPRSDRQQWPVFAAELSMGHLQTAGTQHTQNTHGGQPAGAHVGLRACREDRHRPDNTTVPNRARGDWASANQQAGCCEEVFDLVNCGPRKRFVVRGVDGLPLIVHNCENITQATANDILRHSLRQFEENGLQTVLHVHDEAVVETDNPEAVKQEMERIMCSPPAWAEGIPLAVEAEIMTRYGK